MSYNSLRRSYFDNPTVGDIVEALNKLPKDIPLYFSGSSTGYLHVNLDDKTCCCIDPEDLDDFYDGLDDLCVLAVNKALSEAYYLRAFVAIDDDIDVVIVHYQGDNAKSPTMEIIEDGQFGGFNFTYEAIQHFLPNVNFGDENWIIHEYDDDDEKIPESYDAVIELLGN